MDEHADKMNPNVFDFSERIKTTVETHSRGRSSLPFDPRLSF